MIYTKSVEFKMSVFRDTAMLSIKTKAKTLHETLLVTYRVLISDHTGEVFLSSSV